LCHSPLPPLPLSWLLSLPTRRSSDLLDDDPPRLLVVEAALAGDVLAEVHPVDVLHRQVVHPLVVPASDQLDDGMHYLAMEYIDRSEEHTSELQSLRHLVCRLLLEKKK